MIICIKYNNNPINFRFYEEIENNPLVSKNRAEEFINYMHNYHNSIECSDSWFDVSATRLKEYWSCEGDALLNWKTNGYSKVFDLLTVCIINSI